MFNRSSLFRVSAVGLFCVVSAVSAPAAQPGDVIVVKPDAFPGEMQLVSGDKVSPLHVRPAQLEEGAVGKIRTIARLNDGRTFFASGLDQMVFELTPDGERKATIAWGQVRQVRGDGAGTLYFSCLLTPKQGEALPDGFIYARDLAKGENRAVLTFSQGDVGRDWWGAFDVYDGHIYVGTLHDRTKIYDVNVTPPKLACTLPLAATSFHFDAQGGVFACDGGSQLWHFTDLSKPEETGVSCDLETKLIDFAIVPEPATE